MKLEEKIKCIVPIIVEKNIIKKHTIVKNSKNRIVEDFNDEDTHVILRQFRCKKCHELVTVVNKHDRRTIFCSPRCEKLYWKHPKKMINKN